MLTISADAVKMLRGQGMPSYRHHDHGNLYIQFNVKFPEKGWISDESAFEQLRKILPSPSVQNVPPADVATPAASFVIIRTLSLIIFTAATTGI